MVSGNPAASILGEKIVYIGVFFMLISCRLLYPSQLNQLRLNGQDLCFISIFAVLLILHFIEFGSIVLMSSLGFAIKLGIALFSIRLIPSFFSKYVSVMVWLAGLSLVFYLPSLLGVIDTAKLFSFLSLPLDRSSLTPNIGIHNFHGMHDYFIAGEKVMRNSGMFWEPGAFAGYLLIALFFVVIMKSVSLKKWQVFLLIVALLSTQSTTGFIVGIVLLIYWLYDRDLFKGVIVRVLVFPVAAVFLIVIANFAFSEISFLGKKIEGQIENVSVGGHRNEINRFGNLIYDINFIEQRPLIGWGATPQTRYFFDPELEELISGQGNGLTGFTVKFGLIGILVYFFYLFRGVQRMTNSLLAGGITVCLVSMLLMGEQFLNFPIFLALAFLPNGIFFHRSLMARTT